MDAVKAVVVLIAIVLLVGYACKQDPPQPDAPGPIEVDPPQGPPMTLVTWGRIRFQLPTAWKDNHRDAAEGRQILFDGPRDKGEPTVSLFWAESKRSLESYAEYMRRKFDTPGGPALVVEHGWTTVGRNRAFYLVYEQTRGEIRVGPDGGTHTTVDYYFQHDGHVGFLRCTSLKEYFASVYRPLFG